MSCNCPHAATWQLLETLAQSRTVCVEKLRTDEGQELVRKSYRFPTSKDQLRGMWRGTLFGTPKAERELSNLEYLKRVGVPAVEAIRACVTRTAFGFVVDSHLLTQASAGTHLAQCINTEQIPAAATWAALGTSISRMHQVGFWHRGLAPRNVLICTEAPFHRWLDPAKSKRFTRQIPQAARAADLLRFWNTLYQHVPATHKAAFEQAYGQQGASDPVKLWPAIPKAKRASTARVLRRDEARFEET